MGIQVSNARPEPAAIRRKRRAAQLARILLMLFFLLRSLPDQSALTVQIIVKIGGICKEKGRKKDGLTGLWRPA
jgi:hypothetical protein